MSPMPDMSTTALDNTSLSNDENSESKMKTNVSPIVSSSSSAPISDHEPEMPIRRSSITTKPIKENSKGLFSSIRSSMKSYVNAVNKITDSIKYNTKDLANLLIKKKYNWEIPIDRIANDLLLIGSGNEGKVYLGRLNGQHVACKRVKTEQETNIKHLKKLNHANVIKFHGVSISPPIYYIVMEYCKHGSLYDVLKRNRENRFCTRPTEAFNWLKQISNGVNYLHSNKIVHRDLKSPNILIADNYVLKISDFGTSKELSSDQAQIMSLNGTSAWMAPEITRRECCSEKVDVWSFSVVLWEIVTCEIPYHNMSQHAVLYGVAKGTLRLSLPQSAPKEFQLLMEMCQQSDPSLRPSFGAILEHLKSHEQNIILFEEQQYDKAISSWVGEINQHLVRSSTVERSKTSEQICEDIQNLSKIRSYYEVKLDEVNAIYMESLSVKMQLRKREQETRKKERSLNIPPNLFLKTDSSEPAETTTFKVNNTLGFYKMSSTPPIESNMLSNNANDHQDATSLQKVKQCRINDNRPSTIKYDVNFHMKLSNRQRQRRTLNSNVNKISPSCPRTKLSKIQRSASFHFSPFHDQQLNRHTRSLSCGSSEEGEVEEIQNDVTLLDNEKYEAKHENLNRQSNEYDEDIYC